MRAGSRGVGSWGNEHRLLDAGDEVAGRFLFERRDDGGTRCIFRGMQTSWMKDASTGWMRWRWWFAREQDSRALCGWIWHGDCRQQRLRVGHERPAEQCATRRQFDDAPEIHHRDAIGHVRDYRQIVRDEQIGEAAITLQVTQQVDDLRLHTHIEGGHRFIAHHKRWFDGKRTRDSDPLSLSTGEFVRVATAVLGAKADFIEQSRDATICVNTFRELMDDQAFPDRGADGHTRVERTVRILEHDLHPSSHTTQRFTAEPAHVNAIEMDAAAGGLDQSENRAPGCRLATTRFTNEGQGFCTSEIE